MSISRGWPGMVAAVFLTAAGFWLARPSAAQDSVASYSPEAVCSELRPRMCSRSGDAPSWYSAQRSLIENSLVRCPDLLDSGCLVEEEGGGAGLPAEFTTPYGSLIECATVRWACEKRLEMTHSPDGGWWTVGADDWMVFLDYPGERIHVASSSLVADCVRDDPTQRRRTTEILGQPFCLTERWKIKSKAARRARRRAENPDHRAFSNHFLARAETGSSVLGPVEGVCSATSPSPGVVPCTDRLIARIEDLLRYRWERIEAARIYARNRLERGGRLARTAKPEVPETREVATVEPGGEGAPQAVTRGGPLFVAARRLAGYCEVVVGYEGLEAGDTVLGSFIDFDLAQAAATENCLPRAKALGSSADDSGVPEPVAEVAKQEPAVEPDPEPVPEAPVVTTSSLLALSRFGDDEATKGIFLIDVRSGSATLFDRTKVVPESVQARPMTRNFLTAVGRPRGEAATPGQLQVGVMRQSSGGTAGLLVVDTTTGEMAYLKNFGGGSTHGRLVKIAGSPASGIASSEGNFILLMHRAASGRTDGAFVGNASTGAYYAYKIATREGPPRGTYVGRNLPVCTGKAVTVHLQSGSSKTVGFLLADDVTGDLFWLKTPGGPGRALLPAKLKANLLTVFPAEPEVTTLQRFLAVPMQDGSGATRDVLWLDSGTGGMAMLTDVTEPSKTRLTAMSTNLYRSFPKEVGEPRGFAALSKISAGGSTDGVWVFDSATGSAVYMEPIRGTRTLRVRKVEQSSK